MEMAGRRFGRARQSSRQLLTIFSVVRFFWYESAVMLFLLVTDWISGSKTPVLMQSLPKDPFQRPCHAA
jgi:hypothetical protein